MRANFSGECKEASETGANFGRVHKKASEMRANFGGECKEASETGANFGRVHKKALEMRANFSGECKEASERLNLNNTVQAKRSAVTDNQHLACVSERRDLAYVPSADNHLIFRPDRPRRVARCGTLWNAVEQTME